MKKIKLLLILTFLFPTLSKAQLASSKDSLKSANKVSRFNYKQLIVPTALMAYGLIGMEDNSISNLNQEIREEVNETIDDKVSFDDFTQYAAAVSVYGLNAFGIKGQHNLKDRTIILATSYLIMGSTVYVLKNSTNVIRPDGTSNNSFPSGHTATAFVGAEFIWQEYKDVSVWYGISGYAVGIGTGLFRVYNNRHWLTDVAMGAGIGMLSTKIAYWIFPFVDTKIFKSKKHLGSAMVAPYYNGKQGGIGLVMNLK